jgi:SAM-dependent methyltransferase
MPLQTFMKKMAEKAGPAVLELGTLRSKPTRSTLHRHFVPHAAEYLGTDFQPGPDVDVVCDAHRLSEAFGSNRFDAVISCSTFEHFQYPWIVAAEIGKVLKPSGLVFVQTHHTFPLHAFPDDYFRFSAKALESLFSASANFKVLGSGHEFRSWIFSLRSLGILKAPSYLNSLLTAQKIDG